MFIPRACATDGSRISQSQISALSPTTGQPQILSDMGNRVLILLHDTALDAKVPGTAFHMATVGDSVVLLEGAEHPVMLRQKG